VQTVGAIVGDQVIGLPVQGELGAADAVRIAAGDRAEMTGQCLPIAHAAQAEHNIVHPTGSVGHADFDYGAAKAQKADTHAVVVGHRIDVDRLPVLGLAIRLVLQRAGGGGRAGGERRREGGSQRNHAQRIYAARM
jgi:hypothetical protein